MSFKLRFPEKDIEQWAAQYDYPGGVMDDLEKALGKYHPDKPPTDEMLRMAVMNAAHEAGANFWRSEELVAALHALVAVAGRPQEISETLYAILKRRALVLYFGAHESGA